MKKTMIAVACAAFISTGAIAKPASHQPPKQNKANHPVQVMKHTAQKPTARTKVHTHHTPHVVHVVHSRPTPPPPRHHHHHSNFDFGDALIAFAILATAF